MGCSTGDFTSKYTCKSEWNKCEREKLGNKKNRPVHGFGFTEYNRTMGKICDSKSK